MSIFGFSFAIKLGLSLLTLSLLSSGVLAETNRENRIILDERFNWVTPEGADRMLFRIKEAGFNVIVPCVWHGRGVSWPSSLAPREPIWNKNYTPDHDPLAYLINKAHSLDIEVHPWFTVILRQAEIFDELVHDGVPANAFDIHLPAFRQMMMSLLMEVVSKYNIDGINLDYIRTKGICTSEHCVRDYKRETGRNLFKDKLLHKVSSDAWESIAGWNGKAVESFVKKFTENAKSVIPDLLISVDSHAAYKPLKLQGTDSIKWANEQIVDVIFHMDYEDKLDIELINTAKHQMLEPERLVIMVGNYEKVSSKHVVPRHGEITRHLIQLSRSYGNSGNSVALYQYRFLTDGQIASLRNGPFKEVAKPDWRLQKRKIVKAEL